MKSNSGSFLGRFGVELLHQRSLYDFWVPPKLGVWRPVLTSVPEFNFGAGLQRFPTQEPINPRRPVSRIFRYTHAPSPNGFLYTRPRNMSPKNFYGLQLLVALSFCPLNPKTLKPKGAGRGGGLNPKP